MRATCHAAPARMVRETVPRHGRGYHVEGIRGSPPWLAGSVSSGMIFDISKTVLGQPWVMMRGSGLGPCRARG